MDLELSTVTGSGSTILGNSSSVLIDIFSGAGHGTSINNSQADVLRLLGDFSIGTGVLLTLGNPNGIASGSWGNGDTFQLFDWASLGTRTGTFSGVDYSALNLPSGWTLDTNNLYTVGTVSIQAIPEPRRALLLMLGLAGLVARRRRR